MPAINFNSTLLRLIKDVNDIRSALRRVTVNLPLFDIANENTPVPVVTDQNNYVPGNYDILRLASDQAGRSITGFRGGLRGRFLRLFNVGDYEIFLSHQDTASDPENRIISPTGFDMVLNVNGEILLYYDADEERWHATYNSNADRISAELRLSANQSIGDAVTPYEIISWSTEFIDTGDFFDPLNPTIVTIPGTGWYYLQIVLIWQADDNGLREVAIQNPTLTDPRVWDSRNAVVGAQTVATLSDMVYRDLGDQLNVIVWQNSGAPLNVLKERSPGSPLLTRFVIVKM